MGKLKEQLLNNLTPEEMDERFELSAFEYVEYMENYKQSNSEEIPQEVLETLSEEQKNLEQEYIDMINNSNRVKYTDNDILDVLDGMVDPQKLDIIMAKLTDIWLIKNGLK